MIYALLDAIAANHPYPHSEVYAAYEQLSSIDAVLVAIELANNIECTLPEAIKYIGRKHTSSHAPVNT
jgi:hypothetical protein